MSTNQPQLDKDFEERKKDYISRINRGNWWMLSIIGVDMQNDFDVVHASVSKFGDTLKHVSSSLKNNIYIAVAAIRSNKFSYQHVGESLQNDPAIKELSDIENDKNRAKACDEYLESFNPFAKPAKRDTFFKKSPQKEEEPDSKNFTP